MDDFLQNALALRDHDAISNAYRFAATLLVMAGVTGLVIGLGERLFNFDLRKVIDDIEAQSRKGNVWPATALLCVGMVTLAYLLGGYGH